MQNVSKLNKNETKTKRGQNENETKWNATDRGISLHINVSISNIYNTLKKTLTHTTPPTNAVCFQNKLFSPTSPITLLALDVLLTEWVVDSRLESEDPDSEPDEALDPELALSLPETPEVVKVLASHTDCEPVNPH